MTDRGNYGFFHDFLRLYTARKEREKLVDNIRLAVLFSTF